MWGRNYNNKDLQKYENKLTSVFQKVKSKMPKSPVPKALSWKSLLYSVIGTGVIYVGYRCWEYRMYRAAHYVDIFEIKAKVAKKAAFRDLKEKIFALSFKGNQDFANQIYGDMVLEEVQKALQRIREKNPLKMNIQNFCSDPLDEGTPEEQKVDNRMEIVLTKSSKSVFSVFDFFKLHTKEYQTTLTNSQQIIKKNYYVPITLWGVPFFYKGKRNAKKIGKKTSAQKIFKQKAKLDLHSQCEKINKWNFLFDANRPFTPSTPPSPSPSPQSSTPSSATPQLIESGKESVQKQKSVNNYGNFRNQLLYQCRKGARGVEQRIKGSFGEVLAERWGK